MSQEPENLTVTLTLPADAIAWLKALADNDDTGQTTAADVVTGFVWQEYWAECMPQAVRGPNVVSIEQGRRFRLGITVLADEIPF